MHTNHIQDIKKENAEWLKTLDLMDYECIQMKTKLSLLLEQNSDLFVLESAEQFQNQILMKEEALILMRQDLRAQEQRVQNLAAASVLTADPVMIDKQDQIRKQINYLQKECLQMQEKFNDYVAKHVS